MKARQVQRQLEHQLRRHRIGHRVAIAGGDAIDHPLFGQQAIEKVGTILDATAKIGLTVEYREGLPMGQRHHLFDGQAFGAKCHTLGVSLHRLAALTTCLCCHRISARNQRN